MTANNIGGSGRWLSMDKAAAYLDMEPKRLKRYYRDWKIPCYLAGKEVRFRERDLNTWLLNRPAVTVKRQAVPA